MPHNGVVEANQKGTRQRARVRQRQSNNRQLLIRWSDDPDSEPGSKVYLVSKAIQHKFHRSSGGSSHKTGDATLSSLYGPLVRPFSLFIAHDIQSLTHPLQNSISRSISSSRLLAPVLYTRCWHDVPNLVVDRVQVGAVWPCTKHSADDVTFSNSPPTCSPLSPSITHSLFHSRLKTHLFHKSFPP